LQINITVTGEKIHSFLRGKVFGRKRKNDDSKGIGYSTVRQYGTVCIGVYKQQTSFNMTANPYPQDNPVVNVIFNSVISNKLLSIERTLKTQELAQFKIVTHLWKNCQGLPIIFCAVIPPPALGFRPCCSSHIFV
jgi:ribosomal protein L5